MGAHRISDGVRNAGRSHSWATDGRVHSLGGAGLLPRFPDPHGRGTHRSSLGIPDGWGVLMGGSAGPGIGRSMGDRGQG